VLTDEVLEGDLKTCAAYNRLAEAGAAPDKVAVQLRVFRPTSTLIEDSLDFSAGVVEPMISRGWLESETWT
jgi:hypothetical protein